MTMSPQCYITSSMVIDQLSLEKKIFEGLLPFMDMEDILVKSPNRNCINLLFISLLP